MVIHLKYRSRRSTAIGRRDSEALNSHDRLRLKIISIKMEWLCSILRIIPGSYQNARNMIANALNRVYVDALRTIVVDIPDRGQPRMHYLPMTFAAMEDHLLTIGVTVSERFRFQSFGALTRLKLCFQFPVGYIRLNRRYKSIAEEIILISLSRLSFPSRWTDLYAIPNKEAVSIVGPLLKFFGIFGWPSELRSDGGKEFVNSLITLLMDVVGSQHFITLAYSHEENAIVERANKEVLRRLRDLIFETRLVAIWTDMLPLVQRIMNSHVVVSIGVSPAQIVFGNAIDLDRHFFPPDLTKLPVKEGQPSDNNEIAYRQYLDTLLENQATTIALAQKHLFDNDQVLLSKRRSKGEVTEFPIGSIVLAQYHDTGLGAKPPSKLHPKWEGPFKVVNIINSGNTYVLQNFIDGGMTNRHITDLKVFNHDDEEAHLTLSDVALRDRIHEFLVDSVLSYRFKPREDGSPGDKNKASDLEFHIHWKGFSSRWDSWEPFKNVRLNTTVLKYMRDNKLKRFIPRNLEGDIVGEDAENAHVVPVVNRIRLKSSSGEERKLKRLRFSFPSEENFSISSQPIFNEKRWVYNKRTKLWVTTDEIRHLGPY